MPVQTAVITSDDSATEGNQYSLAGWIAITQAIIFPVSFALGFVEQMIGERAFGYHGPVLGLSDLFGVAFTGMAVYTINKLRHLFRECHDFTAIDTLLLASIWWAIAFQAGGLLLSVAHFAFRPIPDLVSAIVLGSFIAVSMITIGVIDIIIGIRLLRERDRFSSLIKAFAYVSLAGGIAEVSVIFIPLALILIPVTCLIMGLIFLRDNHDVEFV